MQLATRLREDGVDVTIDKWDLLPGHDAFKFMEKMVTDPAVAKVIMICDEKYAEKADKREGGVGTEAQILSPELYGKADQNKYAAVISETDEAGNAYLPTYYRGRIYFNLSSDTRYEEEYDRLLRWIVGKPLFIKPPVGNTPAYLEGNTIKLGTESAFKRAETQLRSGSLTARGALRDYADVFVQEYERLRIVRDEKIAFDDQVVEAISASKPYIRQIEELAIAAARFEGMQSFAEIIKLLERLGTFMFRIGTEGSWRDSDFDAYRFNAHAALLGVLAVALQEERFDLAEALLKYPFMLDRDRSSAEGRIEGFEGFRQYLPSLDETRNSRLGLKRVSVHADLLKEHFSAHTVDFRRAIEADLLLFLRSRIVERRASYGWYPITIIYTERSYRAFDLFVRAESQEYAQKLLPLFGVPSIANLKEKLAEISADAGRLPRDGIGRMSISGLVNLANLATAP